MSEIIEKVLWSAGNTEDFYVDRGFVQLNDYGEGDFQLVIHDGAEGVDFKLTSEQLLDLAYTIYEELG